VFAGVATDHRVFSRPGWVSLHGMSLLSGTVGKRAPVVNAFPDLVCEAGERCDRSKKVD
jgi:hypothetical protein